MRTTMMFSAFLAISTPTAPGCAGKGKELPSGTDPAILQGDAEVKVLEKKGILKDVTVMESFPLQMRVTGPANVIEKLEKLPHKKLDDASLASPSLQKQRNCIYRLRSKIY